MIIIVLLQACTFNSTTTSTGSADNRGPFGTDAVFMRWVVGGGHGPLKVNVIIINELFN